MTEENEPVESTGKQPPAPTIREGNGLLHITVEGKTYVATQEMLASGRFLPVENLAGLRTFFDSRLICWPDSHFSWIDGTPETRVRLLKLGDHYEFFERKDGMIEVPIPMTGYEDLLWVLEGGYQVAEGEDVSSGEREQWEKEGKGGSYYWHATNVYRRKFYPGESLPRVFLVPKGDWQEHAEEVLGITWNADGEDAILAKARSLGYKDPERATKPVSKPSQPAVNIPNQHAQLAPEFS